MKKLLTIVIAPVPDIVRVPASSRVQVKLSPHVPDSAAFTLRLGKIENTRTIVSRAARIFELRLYIGYLHEGSGKLLICFLYSFFITWIYTFR